MAEKMMSKTVMDFEKAGRLALYSLSAVIGLVATNYASGKIAANAYAAWIMIGGGVVSLLIGAVALMKWKSKWAGPVRLFFGISGAVLLIRGIVQAVNPAYRVQLTALTQGVL